MAISNYEKELSLPIYFEDLKNSVPLSYREEFELSKKIRKGDLESRDKLVRANLRFVVSVAREYQNQGLPLGDLISAGNEGMLIAARKFDGDRGFKFITYANGWIRKGIDYALEKERPVHIPLNRIEELNQIKRVIKKEGLDLDKKADFDSIAKRLGLNPSILQQVYQNSKVTQYFEDLISEIDGSPLVENLFIKPPSYLPVQEGEISRSQLQEDINLLLPLLDGREREIIENHFGLNGKEEVTLDELSKRFKISPQRISILKKRALKKLKQPSLENKLKTHYEESE